MKDKELRKALMQGKILDEFEPPRVPWSLSRIVELYDAVHHDLMTLADELGYEKKPYREVWQKKQKKVTQ